MRLEIYGEEVPENKIVRLKLKRSSAGNIDLIAVDENGGYIRALLTLDKNGAIAMQSNLDPSLGFQLNEHGEILTY